MTTHTMRLHDEPFKRFESREKSVEYRLNDEKRKGIKVGDTIEFTNRTTGEILTMEVTHLEHADTFTEFLDDVDDNGSMNKYYDLDAVERHGVVGIHLRHL